MAKVECKKASKFSSYKHIFKAFLVARFELDRRDVMKSDVELLCEMIYQHGERYSDGTAAIDFADLFKVCSHFNYFMVCMTS